MSWLSISLTIVLGGTLIILLKTIVSGTITNPTLIIISVTTLSISLLCLILYLIFKYLTKSFKIFKRKPKKKRFITINSHKQISRKHDPIDPDATEILMKSIRGIPYLIQAIQYSMETTYYPTNQNDIPTTSVIHTAPGCTSVLDCDSDEEREELIKRISPRNSGPEEKWLPEDPKKWTNQQLRLSMNRASQSLLVFPYSESSTKASSFDKDSNKDLDSITHTPRLSFETAECPPVTKYVSSKTNNFIFYRILTNELSPRTSEIRCISMSSAFLNKLNSSFKQNKK
uniref:EEV glycoprotein n=1 Tax=Strongyloides papillosus TaxID=174720 RepID=A0A0N5C151_STREA